MDDVNVFVAVLCVKKKIITLARTLHAYDQLVEAINEKSLYDPVETDVQLASVFIETTPVVAKALTMRNCTSDGPGIFLNITRALH
ncbi:hypothetical protein HPB50_022021 [Hyalomma asiaticum]|uniref:Uncharacterized protein n=1 Tax=Hyalomma asiaticum TaxID=266040 RepID=A0ACB7SXE0_HYAAI|nr:hypothetical protein HPB50_022021 [Hyalomma asiaticum]